MPDAGVPDWVTVRTIDIAAPIPGSTTIGPFGSNLVADDYRVSGVPVVFVRDIREASFDWKSGVYVDTAKAAELRAHSVEPGDLVATKMGLPPCIAAEYPYSMPPGIITADIIRLRPDVRKTDVRWLVRAINSHSVQVQVRAITGGVTRPKITLRDFRELQLNLPSLAEQQCIAGILDTLEEVIRKTEHLIAKLTQVKQGLLYDLLTRGIDDNGELRDPARHPERFKDSWLGSVPSSWRVCPLGDVVPRAVYGISVSLDGEDGIPVLRMNNFRDGEANLSELKYSASSDAQELLLRPDDVLFNRTNSIEHVGRTGIWRGQLEKASFASYLVRLETNPTVLNNEFLCRWLNWDVTQIRIRRYATPGVHQVNINPTNLRRTLMALPASLREQEAIVSKLASADHRLKMEMLERDKLVSLKKGLMEDLLTGRVRVTNLLKEAAA
jgi:type I restriction enzyme, S subunit